MRHGHIWGQPVVPYGIELPAEQPDKPGCSLPQFLAVVLGIGGGFWGIFLCRVYGSAALIPLPFGVGYAVTAGYVYWALRVPPFRTRRRIWLASLVVQGAWLVLAGLPLLGDAGLNLISVWWLFATGCSVVGLMSEQPDRPDRCSATSPDPVTTPVLPPAAATLQR